MLDEEALAAAGFGGVLGVGRRLGPPAPAGPAPCTPAPGPKVALVGKGITFDSGGISHQAVRRAWTR